MPPHAIPGPEAAADPCIHLDADARVLQANAEAERILQRAGAALSGQAVHDAFRESAASPFGSECRWAIAEQCSVAFEAYSAGLGLWLEVRAAPEGQALTVRFRDVSARKQASDALRHSEERFRHLARAMADAVWDWDLLAGTIWWSDGVHRLLGESIDELDAHGRAWASRLHPQDRDAVTRGLDAVLAGTGEVWSDEFRIRRADASYAHVSSRGFVIRDVQGRAVRFVGGMTDITERRRQADEERLDAATRVRIVTIQKEIASADMGLQAVLDLMAERAQMFTDAAGAEIEMPEHDVMVCRAMSGAVARPIGARLPLTDSLSGLAFRTGETLLASDTELDPRVDRAACRAVNARAMIAAPLQSGEQTIGTLKVLSDRPGSFGERDVRNIRILVESLGGTIERLRVAEQLRASEAQYRLLFDSNPQAMWVYEVGTLRFLAVNRAAELQYGYAESELLSKTVPVLWPADGRSDLLEQLEAVPHLASTAGLQRRHRRRDGTELDVEISGDGIVFNGRDARLILGTDVTRRLQAERELARLSRAQRMLSACNESVIRAGSEQALLHEVCRIAVEIGGYAMTWVGYANDDAEQTIRVMANAGANADYMKGIVVSWADDGPNSQGPAARCLRSGELVIVEDIACDPSFAPWLDDALASGFRGVACLPLREARRTFGLLYLYAPDIVHFGSDEIALLQELANDLAFGIGHLRVRAQQSQLQAAVLKMAMAVSAQTGDAFFEQLAHHVAQALGARAAFVARLTQQGEKPIARTIAAVVDGRLHENMDYALHGTPSEALLGVNSWFTTDLPPRSPRMAAALGDFVPVAYAGCRLENAAGEMVGMIVALLAEMPASIDFVTSTLQIFAVRAASELERQGTDLRLRRQASLLDQAQDAIVVYGIDHKVQYWNKSAERLYGWSAADVAGDFRVTQLYGDTAAFHEALRTVQAQHEWSGETTQRRKDGSSVAVEARWTLVPDEQGRPGSILAIHTDITERKEAEREIQKLAFYDPLTQLPNRLLLMDRLHQALGAELRTGRGGALLFIDLDNFKILNDTLGHDKGDLLLQQVAARLTACVRVSDTVARLGGDEFVVMLEDLGDSPQEVAIQAKHVGEKILAALTPPYQLDGNEHLSTSSIGIAPFNRQHEGVGELLKQADIAMYQAKAAGRNTLRFFDPGLQAAVTARVALEADLRLALTQEEFLLHYQPQVDGEGRVTGVEALVRWVHPQRGLVSPADFIPLAEETGMILPLGRWVLEQACNQLARWAAQPATAALGMAVNVSSRQFRHPDFVAQVAAVLARTGADARLLKLELTESLLVDDMELTIGKMSALKTQGVGFALDDFGTGYSSLSYLRRLPLDQLKIDQSFVRDAVEDANDGVIVRTIIGLARSLGLSVIAEGVETEAQRAFLAREGCHAYQGYLFSRPLPPDQLAAYLPSRLGAASD